MKRIFSLIHCLVLVSQVWSFMASTLTMILLWHSLSSCPVRWILIETLSKLHNSVVIIGDLRSFRSCGTLIWSVWYLFLWFQHLFWHQFCMNFCMIQNSWYFYCVQIYMELTHILVNVLECFDCICCGWSLSL